MFNAQGGKIKCSKCEADISFDARSCPFCGDIVQTVSDNYSTQEQLDTKKMAAEILTEYEEANSTKTVNDTLSRKENTGEISRLKAKKLTNKSKAFITAACSIIPGIGQVAGLIISIALMSSEDDDKVSFGSALLGVSLIVFAVTCVFYFMLGMIGYTLLVN